MPKISIFVFLLELQIGSDTVISVADSVSTLFGAETGSMNV